MQCKFETDSSSLSMATNHTRYLLSFVPMMITRIILSLKKAASIPTRYDTAETPNKLPAPSQELQEIRELQYNQVGTPFPHAAGYIRSDLERV